MSETWSILRPTLLGSLLDAAERNVVARRARPGAVRVRHRLPRGRRRSARRRAPCARRADRRRAGAGRLARRAAPCAADFFAAKGLLAAVLDTLGVRLERRRGAAAVPAPRSRRRACSPASGGSASSASCIRSSPRTGTSSAPRSGRSTWASAAELAPELAAYEPFAEYPPLREDLAVVVADGVAAAEVIAVVREAGGAQLAARRGVRRLSRRAGGGGARVARPAPRVPRRRPHAARRGRRAAARARSPRRSPSALGGELRA